VVPNGRPRINFTGSIVLRESTSAAMFVPQWTLAPPWATYWLLAAASAIEKRLLSSPQPTSLCQNDLSRGTDLCCIACPAQLRRVR
jgi:hypothetical protein